MIRQNDNSGKSPLLLIAGAKGAIASTLAVAVAVLRQEPESIRPALMTADQFPCLSPLQEVYWAGWDKQTGSLIQSIQAQGIVPEPIWKPHVDRIAEMPVRPAPSLDLSLEEQVRVLESDIHHFKERFPQTQPVLINLLPSAPQSNCHCHNSLEQMLSELDPEICPDMAYLIAAVRCEIPVVNFTPNDIESPAVLEEAQKRNVPIAGRDGKTGQTYFKMVLASAFKARSLTIDGWYSLNILGNEDGKNLMDPQRAACKMANKTEVLEEILGYPVGARYGASSHKVHIDYYPPRGDAKEAWDAIDFSGLFGLPMSLRLNLLGRDSVLAAPMVLDLARWMAALKCAGFAGAVPQLGFFFKRPIGENTAVTFQDQVLSLERLAQECDRRVRAKSSK